jgi:probable HAF family extracellular repeat protein
MKQLLSGLTKWGMAGVLAGIATAATADFRGFLDVGGTFTTIDVPGATYTQASGINNAGQIVGGFFDSNGISHGFLKVGGTFRTIDAPGATLAFASGTIATGINDAG